MVNRYSNEAPTSATPFAPVIKRKRRADCLGEQERRERKRAIDREAQRSLREKTKTHIAELERTIEILRDQEQNGATASLLSEINALREENERLRDVIDTVKSVVGSEMFPRATNNATKRERGGSGTSLDAASVAFQSSKRRTRSMSGSFTDGKPPLQSSPSIPPHPMPDSFETMDFNQVPMPNTISPGVDLDGMTVRTCLVPVEELSSCLNLKCADEDPEYENTFDVRHVPNSPATAAFVPLLDEIFGPRWRCPSPYILHIGNAPTETPSPSSNSELCPIWMRSNEMFGKVFNHGQGTAAPNIEPIEAGLLFLGIKQGWESFNEWMQSPILTILKEVDQFLFSHKTKIERLATAYKSFKLLKYYVKATKEELEKVPEWLRPSHAQAMTRHPITIDFFPWPTLRDRLVQCHHEIFTNQDMAYYYSHCLRFDWPFSFEDTFFFDNVTQAFQPSPLFEHYHRDLKYWTVAEKFYERYPEMKNDILGDQRRFAEVKY